MKIYYLEKNIYHFLCTYTMVPVLIFSYKAKNCLSNIFSVFSILNAFLKENLHHTSRLQNNGVDLQERAKYRFSQIIEQCA